MICISYPAEYYLLCLQIVSSLGEKDKVWLPSNCSEAVSVCVPEDTRHKACTPVTLSKAIKNETEITGELT